MRHYKKQRLIVCCIAALIIGGYEVFRSTAFQGDHKLSENDHLIRDQPTNKTPSIQYVIVLAYQRTGSTFMGQIFNNNPDALYLFEPLDGIYSSMYGTKQGYNMPSDITTNPDGSIRILPPDEAVAVAETMGKMLTCDFKDLPPEILTHKFFNPRDGLQHAIDDYIKCVRKVAGKPCQSEIEAICPTKIGQREDNKFETNLCASNLWFGKIVEEYGYYEGLVKISHRTAFGKYVTCSKKKKKAISHCVKLIEEPCKSAKIRTMKTVRLTMQTVEKLLDKFYPNVKILHQMRDPRGVVISRLKDSTYRSQFSGGNIVREAKLYCSTIIQDLKKKRELETKYPGAFYPIIYDEFTGNIVESTDKVYKFLGLPTPEKVGLFLESLASKMDLSGMATTWMKKIKPEKVPLIEQTCKEFFKQVEYDWPEYTHEEENNKKKKNS